MFKAFLSRSEKESTVSKPMTNFEKVGNFHEVFDHPKYLKLNSKIFEENPKLVDLRVKLIIRRSI